MNLLQVFFIVSGIIIFIISFDIAKKQKFNALHFLIFLWIWFALLLFSFFPSFLNWIWWFFGLQRGADLLVYSSIIFLIYFVLLLLSKHVDNKDSITDLVRELAIENSEKIILKGRFIILVRAYNEWGVIKNTINEILKSGFKDVLVVNDGSTDNTRREIESIKSNDLVILNHYKNRWAWAALETWFEYIRRYGDVNYIVTFDADWQHDISDLKKVPDYVKKYKSVDVFIGSRFLSKKQIWIPLMRKIILKLWIVFTFLFSRVNLSDSHNGFRVFNRSVLDKVHITIDSMWYASELIDMIASKKIPFKEIPVNIKYTDYSISKWQKNSNAFFIALRFIWNKFFR